MKEGGELINPNDLVLKLSEEANNFDISKYEDFINELCGAWEFQIEATRKVLKFFLSGKYRNTEDLVRENFQKNEVMQGFFQNEEQILSDLLLKDKLSCTIDLATGTGKTWVMYAVARIMLAEGKVDNVLILCPSLTIKYELLKKFHNFITKSNLQNAFSRNSKYRNPGIIQANQAIRKGDIMIDNIHKTFEHVQNTAIKDLKGANRKILVINDEAHHFINAQTHASANENKDMLEWEKFLKNPEYNFTYILNSSGTPYKGNNYFKDVIYRYSIRQAIEERMVKDIDYLVKFESGERSFKKKWNKNFELIYKIHKENKEKYSKVKKHITIFVTNKIVRTDEIANEISKFLKKEEGGSLEEAHRKVLPVTSSQKHEKNREILKTVDEPENPVEWIVSVSMLTEGWDVNNVFQIVPHEDKAFNSKLLIAQVLGRGLRVPPIYQNDSNNHPKVTIFNHDAWGPAIDNLVMGLTEIGQKIISKIDKNSKYNFLLYYLNIDKEIKTETKTPTKGKVQLPKSFGFSSRRDLIRAIHRDIKTREETERKAKIDLEEYTLKEAVNEVFNSILLLDLTHGTNFTKKANKAFIESLVKKELKNINEKTITEANLQKAKLSFNTLYRKLTGQSKIINVYSKPIQKSTKDMNVSYSSINEIKYNKGIMYSEKSLRSSTEKELKDIYEAIGEIPGKRSIKEDENNYKSPLNITILSSEPEIEFVKNLSKYSDFIDCWIKSKDKGFYSIPYIYRPGTHSQQKQFNPDFIIKKGKKIIFVEIKQEEDTDLKNRDKIIGAMECFKNLNNKLEKKSSTYNFYFLTPGDYMGFFEKVVKNNKIFMGDLHANLLTMSREELR